MVSTRRSRSAAGTQSNTEQDAEAGPLSQTEVISKLKSSRVSAGVDSGHAPALQPIEEEQPAAATRHIQPHAEDGNQEAGQQAQQQQQQQQQHAIGQRQQPQRRQQRPLSSPAPAVAGGRAAAAADDAAAAGCDSEDDDGWDFDGPDMLQNLAATIRSALGSSKSSQQQQQQHVYSTAGDGAAGDEDMDVEQLRWRPHTGLQLPHKAAQVVATAAATAAASQQQHEPAAGPVVNNSVLQEQDQDAAAAAAAGPAVVAASKPKGLAKHSRAPTQDAAAAAKEARKAAPETAGKSWYDLPAVKIDDNVKRDLRLLRLRGAYDPKRFYKSFDETKFPKHFAIGTVVDDPLDYYGGRLTTGQRKATLTEQLLADAELQATRKKRFNKLQEEAQKWVKHKKRKTSLPRKTPSKHRPKH